MNIIPAIDLKDGKCVRLFKGDFDQTTEYSDNPVGVARKFSEFKVRHLHVVDLDGARTGTQSNFDIVRAITESTPLSVQLGGGIRDRKTLDGWLASGVTRCVVGSVAITDPDEVRAWMTDVGPESVVLALDVRIENDEPFITTHGWTRSSGMTLWSCIDSYLGAGLSHVLCTDVSRDGAMAGPNTDLYREVLKRYPQLQLQASGGVRSIEDMHLLREAGLPAAISGKAILDGNISAEEISTFQQNA
ncbi:MAG: 1-(5-phosphoribosyl)-5-[(5-phosphoribosylamino)methylideneamino]imidazole-4-carboxamide isomerase [Woeseiaceae bacterium]|nr:1-(5-phosphoribosyl)-5-[(5-phosphoribosylamino)methylideneamino]imidazole-4-carboxamide isomerase [Woeseiaceae bacterium]